MYSPYLHDEVIPGVFKDNVYLQIPTYNDDMVARRFLLWSILELLTQNRYRFSYKLKASTIILFSRFLLKKSTISPDEDPRSMMYTAWMLGTKVEELSTRYTLECFFTPDVAQVISVEDVIALEVPLLDSCEFDLTLKHIEEPLGYLTNAYYRWIRSTVQGKAIKTGLYVLLINVSSELQEDSLSLSHSLY